VDTEICYHNRLAVPQPASWRDIQSVNQSVNQSINQFIRS